MQMETLKAGKSEQYFVVLAMISYLKEQKKYEGLLLFQEKGQERSRYEASSIRICSKKKDIVYKQLRQIAEMYPPQKDITIIDTEEIGV